MTSPALGEIDVSEIVRSTLVARVEHHQELDSTNNEAKRIAASRPVGLPLLIVADRQTAGRGRESKRWWTGQGSLAMTLLVDLTPWKIAPADRPRLALATGIAVAQSVASLVAPQPAGIHWPNDVYVAGRKVSGILIEGLSEGLAVFGIGVNTNNSMREAPEELRAKATTLLDLTGRQQATTPLAIAILRRLEDLLGTLASQPETIGRLADSLCLQRGKNLSLQSGGALVTGCCVGIATDGSLLLDTPQGRKNISSGVQQ